MTNPVDILLVDDTHSNLLAIEEVLAKPGQNIVKAGSGREALKILLKRDFAVILLDINMPGMDGFETASLIRQRKNSESTPIIFITAYEGSEAQRNKGYALGAVDTIFSPVVPEILKSKVSVFVELYKKTAQVRQLNEELTSHARILEQKVRERTWDLSRSNRELARLNKNKSEFTSMVTHELRTPLAAIKGGIELVLDGVDGPVTKEQVDTLVIVKNNVDRLAKLIQNVLDLSKLESGKMELFLGMSDMKALMAEIYALMNPVTQKKGVSFSFELPKEDLYAVCDADKVRQVIINLIDNAVKFTDKGGEITARLSQRDEVVFIEVEDTGVGIKKEDCEKIFEMFTQGPQIGARKTAGSGIGLTVCRRIAELHHGTLTVDSALGRGTTFRFAFPLGLSVDDAVRQAPCRQVS